MVSPSSLAALITELADSMLRPDAMVLPTLFFTCTNRRAILFLSTKPLIGSIGMRKLAPRYLSQYNAGPAREGSADRGIIRLVVYMGKKMVAYHILLRNTRFTF